MEVGMRKGGQQKGGFESSSSPRLWSEGGGGGLRVVRLSTAIKLGSQQPTPTLGMFDVANGGTTINRRGLEPIAYPWAIIGVLVVAKL